MAKIAILSDTLCNQIAAGEVVERPAAVVKELVENSIDADSKKISVNLIQGGRKELRVADNGSGMSPDDALMALERHATSKLRSLDDLQSVQSLGFRGEALPSIAAVSRFELTTREPEAVSGAFIRVEGGVLKDVRETGCSAGTLVTVRDLFYNVPVRRKFLRSVETEMANIADQFVRLCLAHPHIHFQLSHQDRMLYNFPRDKNHEDRILQYLGADSARDLRAFDCASPPYEIHGFAGSPEVQRSNSKSLFVYVNGRPIWDRLMNQSIMRAYDTLIPRGKFPLVVLFLKLPATLVDVNVHPTKREIRFRRPGEIMQLVQTGIRKVLEGARTGHARHLGLPLPNAPGNGLQSPSQVIRERQISLTDSTAPWAGPAAAAPRQMGFPAEPTGEIAWDGPAEQGMTSAPPARICFSKLLVLGQLANAYILLEAPDGLVMVDQHAAHERILYDKLSVGNLGESGTQRLTRSVVLELFPREAAMLRRWMNKLSQVGFEIEPFGPHSFIIQAVPDIFRGQSPEVLLREMLEQAEEEQPGPDWDVCSGLAKSAACHGAVRAGQRLHKEEIRQLLEDLDGTLISATCPHGRPVWHKFTHAEIARIFNRT
ncbi:DNA mismatch repair endonuclease MutL [Desulfoferrobacter suflitae]|uniref:DNA mismatch repair endonuclease MutL n=1 Tax=Desulfoferrobacter suflitae TaxID=2865782 RepID=UPI00216457CA|nr:DNA mismatch repair endonuclease MutL [Desulfoferrobacter suflitae]MCK8600550.1 DNA mismatch repair endonuclease MutL [Desulfoferrobacter suflitae]